MKPIFKVMNCSESDSSIDSDYDPPESPEYELYLGSTEECYHHVPSDLG